MWERRMCICRSSGWNLWLKSSSKASTANICVPFTRCLPEQAPYPQQVLCVAAYCSVLQCVCVSQLRGVLSSRHLMNNRYANTQCVAVCSSVLPCVPLTRCPPEQAASTTGTYIHICIHTCVHICVHTFIPSDLHTYIYIYMHTHIQTYKQTDLHTYMNYIHTWIT